MQAPWQRQTRGGHRRHGRARAPAPSHDHQDALRRVARADSALIWLLLYRPVLAALLWLLFSYPPPQPWLGSDATVAVARIILALHALSVLAGGLMIALRRPRRARQIQSAIVLDIIVYTLLMHLAGGVASGLGLLPAIAVIAGAILMEGRLSLLFAALATVGVIGQQVYTHLTAGAASGSYPQAGLLGLTYFAVGVLAHVMTRRLRASERLAARRQSDLADLARLNDNVIQRMSMGVVAIDGEHRLLLLNDAARQLLDTPGAQPGERLLRLAPPLEDWLLHRLRAVDAADQDDVLVRIGDNEVLPSLRLLGDSPGHGALIYLRDRRELLRQAQEMKLAALGGLTASIAHNIRNPLSSVTHAAQLLGESPRLDAADTDLLAIVQRNARRVDETVSSILALSRRHAAARVDLDLVAWLRAFADEYRGNHPERAAGLRVLSDSAALPVRVDPRHLGQMLHNLCDNAFQHGHRDGTAAQVVLHAAHHSHPRGIRLDVRDTGPGVAPEHHRQIFEPFFTTAANGTGLGLYIARTLAEANGIRLEYISAEPAAGRFRLLFGMDRRAASAATAAAAP